jgi:hypothetical protein
MKMNKDGKEYCGATFLGEFWHKYPNDQRELRYAIAVEKPIDLPVAKETPEPLWEFETTALKQKVWIRRGTMPDELKIEVVFG